MKRNSQRGGSDRRNRTSLFSLPLLGVVALLALGACAQESPEGDRRQAQTSPEASAPAAAPTSGAESGTKSLLLASLAHSDSIAIIDPAVVLDPSTSQGNPVLSTVPVGHAPWGVGAHESTGYVATAEGLAIVDLERAERTALVPFAHPANTLTSGEYRPGGLGLAVAPDGERVYVAVTSDGTANWLEVFDTARGEFVASVPVGARPFEVLVAPDGAWVASIDHDSFSVTVVDTATLTPATHRVAPFGSEGGFASWEKAHYGAVGEDGTILLPYQGIEVVQLDPLTGKYSTIPSGANSHAHGTALSGSELLTVGTGSFGNATGEANLSLLNMSTGEERLLSLARVHEDVAVWKDADGAEFAALTGGNTRDMGWDGVTLVTLSDLSTREIPVAGYPQAVVAFTASGS